MFENKKQTALERDAFALMQNTKTLGNYQTTEWERFRNDPDNNGENQILFSFEDDEWYCECCPSNIKPFNTFSSSGPTLEVAIKILDKKINKWITYHNVHPISMREVLDSPDGTFFHSKYDKTNIAVKFENFLYFLKFDINIKEFDIKQRDQLNPEDEDWDTESFYVPYKNYEDVVETLLTLWKNGDEISGWRFIYPPSTPTQHYGITPYRSLKDLNGDVFFLYDYEEQFKEDLNNISKFCNNLITPWNPTMVSKNKPN
jgi:hypothetical protein